MPCDLLFQAHQGQGAAVGQAQRELLCRYCGPIYRFLFAVLRDADAGRLGYPRRDLNPTTARGQCDSPGPCPMFQSDRQRTAGL